MHRAETPLECRPPCWGHYTAADLWTDEHISSRMLALHLDGSIDIASRKTSFVDRSAAWIIARFGLAPGMSVADFGCGPGLYASRLAASGAAVTGIDFSPRSLAFARADALRRGLSIDYRLGNYLEFESRARFDLITLIMCDYCALGPAQRASLLDVCRRQLRPGGALLLDVYSLQAFAARREGVEHAPDLDDGFWAPRPYQGSRDTFKYPAERVVLDRYTIVEADRTRVVYNWLQYFDPPSLRGEIEGRGLVVEEFLGDVAGAAYDATRDEFAVVARHVGGT